MRKPTSWSRFLICSFLPKNYVHASDDRHLKYKGHVQAIFRDMTS